MGRINLQKSGQTKHQIGLPYKGQALPDVRMVKVRDDFFSFIKKDLAGKLGSFPEFSKENTQFIHEPCDLVTEGGRLLVSYRPNVFAGLNLSWAKPLAVATSARGHAAGPVDLSLFPPDHYVIDGTRAFKRTGDIISNKATTNPVFSGVVNAESLPKRHVAEVRRLSDFLTQKVAEKFRALMPQIAEAQKKLCEDLGLCSTNSFSYLGDSAAINSNHRTGIHLDGKRHHPDGWELILSGGEFVDGALALVGTDQQICFPMPPGSMLAFQATKIPHGNLAIGGERQSFVLFLQADKVKHVRQATHAPIEASDFPPYPLTTLALFEDLTVLESRVHSLWERCSPEIPLFSHNRPIAFYAKLKRSSDLACSTVAALFQNGLRIRLRKIETKFAKFPPCDRNLTVETAERAMQSWLRVGPVQVAKAEEGLLCNFTARIHPPCKQQDIFARLTHHFLVSFRLALAPDQEVTLARDCVLQTTIAGMNTAETMLKKTRLNQSKSKTRTSYMSLIEAASWYQPTEYDRERPLNLDKQT